MRPNARSATARAEAAIADVSVFDHSKMPADAETQLADFNAGRSGGAAKRLSPQLEGKRFDQLVELLDREVQASRATKRGEHISDPTDYTSTQTQLVYDFTDGTIIRLKPKGDKFNLHADGTPTPMFSIELRQVPPGNANPGQAGIAFKVDKHGHAVPKGRAEIRNPYEKGRFLTQFERFEQVVFEHSHREALP
jgi:hypothetical protein